RSRAPRPPGVARRNVSDQARRAPAGRRAHPGSMTTMRCAAKGRTLTLGAWVLLALLAVPLPPRLAGQTVRFDETRPVGANAEVAIGVISHSLRVEGWDRNEVRVTGEYDPSIEELLVESDGRGVSIG